MLGASALLVILSKASVQSEWCKKELNVGLIRELSEKRVVVLPVVVEDCDIPLFLRDKMYADFRSNFDDGLSSVIMALGPIMTENQGRIVAPEWHTDWAIDWASNQGQLCLHLTMIEAAELQPYSVLTTIEIEAGQELSYGYLVSDDAVKVRIRRHLIGLIVDHISDNDEYTFLFEDNIPIRRRVKVPDPATKGMLDVFIVSRWVGTDTGRAVLFRLGGQIGQIREHMDAVAFMGPK